MMNYLPSSIFLWNKLIYKRLQHGRENENVLLGVVGNKVLTLHRQIIINVYGTGR